MHDIDRTQLEFAQETARTFIASSSFRNSARAELCPSRRKFSSHMNF